METIKSKVVIAGGGPSGTFAAIAAARNGAEVLLIEQYGVLGGMSTMGAINPWMSFHEKLEGDVLQGRQVITGIPHEMVLKMIEMGACPGYHDDTIGEAASVTPFDPETVKYLWQKMCLDAGVRIMYHTYLIDAETSNGRVTALRGVNKGGQCRIEGDIFLDCTGDADLAAMAGCPFEIGRAEDGKMMPGTMNFTMANVDFEKVRVYMVQNPDEFWHNTRFDILAKQEPTGVSGFYTIWNKVKQELETPILRDRFLFFKGYRGDQATVNTSRVSGIDSTTAEGMTRGEIEGRCQAMEIAKCMVKYLPGFENAYVLSTGAVIGVRESRRISGEYMLNSDDLIAGRSFPDDIMTNAYTIDMHGADDDSVYHLDVPPYGVPYRVLLPRNIDNMIVAGRTISATREAHGSMRTTPACMALGQAAGTAAAVAAKSGAGVKDVDISALRGQLLKDNVYLL